MSVFTQYLDFGSPFKLLLGATSLAIIFGVCKLVNHVIITPYFSPLHDLPGPKSPSFVFGNFREIFKAEPGELHKKWVAEYGPTLASRRAGYCSSGAERLLRCIRAYLTCVSCSYGLVE